MVRPIVDHVDLRVSDMATALAFYCKLLPALGFKDYPSEGHVWDHFMHEHGPEPAFGFGKTADPEHRPNATRIAFNVASREDVERIARIVRETGGREIDGPCKWPPPSYPPSYHALFFEDPCGNRLEVYDRRE